MKPLINDNLKESLVNQISDEIYNSHLYLHIATFLHGKGLDNLAKVFQEQWSEEQQHSQMIFSLLNDLGVTFSFPSVDGCDMEFKGIVEVAEAYLNKEYETTMSLNEIKLQAMDESDPNPVVEERMREMIKLQQKEFEEATAFLDKANLIGDDWKFVMLWDAALGE